MNVIVHHIKELKVISFSDHNYTNVNIATSQGIKHALNLGLVPSHLADTIVSAHVDLIPSLFNANDRGRAFVLLRHPVDRAASMFYFLKNSGYLPLKNMTVDDYAKSEYIENNWLGTDRCTDIYCHIFLDRRTKTLYSVLIFFFFYYFHCHSTDAIIVNDWSHRYGQLGYCKRGFTSKIYCGSA